jgi:hypothetical protein
MVVSYAALYRKSSILVGCYPPESDILQVTVFINGSIRRSVILETQHDQREDMLPKISTQRYRCPFEVVSATPACPYHSHADEILTRSEKVIYNPTPPSGGISIFRTQSRL